MKYEKPIINITLLSKDDIVVTSLITDGDGYTDTGFQEISDV